MWTIAAIVTAIAVALVVAIVCVAASRSPPPPPLIQGMSGPALPDGSQRFEMGDHAPILGDYAYLIGGYQFGDLPNGQPWVDLDTTLRYNFKAGVNGAWEVSESLDQPRGYPASATFKGSIYVTGGISNHVRLNSVKVFDGQSWSDSHPMNQPRKGHALVNYKDQYLFVIGGLVEGDTGSQSVERYDGTSWTPMDDIRELPFGIIRPATAVVGDLLFLIGGMVETVAKPDVLSLNVSHMEAGWTRREQLHTPRGKSTAAVFGNKIYVMGGWTQSIEIGTVVGGSVSWQIIEDTDATWGLTASSRASFQYQNQIFLVAGCDSHNIAVTDTTILITTEDPDENVRLSSDVGRLNDGKVSQVSRLRIDKEHVQSQHVAVV